MDRISIKNNRITIPSDNRLKSCTMADIQSEISMWIDFSDDASVVLNGNNISSITDKSDGNIDFFKQATATYQPSYVNTINGLKVGTFNVDGSLGQFLKWKGDFDLNDNTLLLIFKPTNVTHDKESVFSCDGGGNDFQIQSDDYDEWEGDIHGDKISEDDWIDHLLMYSIDMDSVDLQGFRVYQNRELMVTATEDRLGTTSLELMIGINRAEVRGFIGHICEIICVSRQYRTFVEHYLANKWGVLV